MKDNATILAVDDTSESLALLVKILSEAGYRVLPADSGELALASVAVNPPDLVVLDIRMRGMSGIDLCRRLRASETTRRVPVILMSAFADVQEWAEGLQLGAADYIHKPFQAAELLARIAKHLELRRLNAALEQQQIMALREANERLQAEIAVRQRVEEELRQNLEAIEASRREMLHAMAEQKRVEAERQILEDQLRRAQKLESVGQLAGGIAHDFNNILMGLFGSIALAKNELAAGHPGLRPLEEAEKSMGRAIRLSKQLLTFSKGGDPLKEELCLGGLVEEVVRGELANSNVELVLQLAPDLWRIHADKWQLQQVIVNLTSNAREAMPEGGHLYVALENAAIEANVIPSLAKGRYVKVTFRDEGMGIAPDVMGRIFDPYFTTKHLGKGLGLASAYSIISKHGGYISAASEVGKGAVFSIYLVASGEPIVALAQPPATMTAKIQPSSRVLVLDDEDFIRYIIPRWLRNSGCCVEVAADGREAIDMYKRALGAGQPFDLLILDLTIPGGIGGVGVIKEIHAVSPDVKAIISSGYADGPVMSNYGAYGFKGIIAKPYTESQLSAVVAQVLS